MARVAIAMAVYNDARYLPLALEALARQRHRDFELTVLDDGSTDDSAAIVERFADRLPLTLVRAEHRGRQLAKQAAWAAAQGGDFLFALDSDIALPDDALGKLVACMDADPRVAVVSAVARAERTRPYGATQAFLEDLVDHSNAGADGGSRWIIGGCALFRRTALASVEVRNDVGEDNDLSEKLRRDWRLVLLRDLVATHYGVPTTLGGVLQRFARDGERVRALLRVYPQARQIGNVARLVPLPLVTAGVAGALTGQLWLTGGATTALAAYVAAFLYASRAVPARLPDRLAAAMLFTVGNLGFGVGYLREALRASSGGVVHERGRSY